MLIVQAPNEELLKDVSEDREELAKDAQEALDANEKEGKEIEKYHGDDTKALKKIITDKDDKKQLKAMHLSEALFEDLDDSNYLDVISVCDAFRDGDIGIDELIDDLTYIQERIHNGEKPENYEIPGFEDTKELWDKLDPFLVESLTEELSEKGQKILDELKKELGPDLQKKVAYVIKDYAKNEANSKKQSDDIKENLKKKLTEEIDDYDFELEEERKIFSALEKHHIYPDDLGVYVTPSGNLIVVDIYITNGDWKHEHWACEEIMKELGYSRISFEPEDNGTDTFDAWHKYVRNKDDSVLSENWSVFHESDIPEEGTLFNDEDSARKFQKEMGEGWRVKKLNESVINKIINNDKD